MPQKFTHDISSNALQVIVNQICGLGIFYILSTHLDKTDFGEINWTLAVLLTIFGILTCGIDQVAVRRIASGQDEKRVLSIYISHVVFSGLMIYLILLINEYIFPIFFQKHFLLLLLGTGKLMIFFSTPFKQLATGLEKFRPLLFMSVASNIFRSVALLSFALFSGLSINLIIIIFIGGDLVELLLCIIVTQRIIKVPVLLNFDNKEYYGILKESMPQLGVAVFTSIISRFDWIYLGLFSSSVILANYSFAYKIFEMATLPMLVLAPLLIPRFTKIFHPDVREPEIARTNDILVLLRIEMAISSLVALVINIMWVPIIDLITNGKYGMVNRYTVLFLTAAMPFLYLNNFLWTINFARGYLKMIFIVFAVTFAANITADIILIHFYHAEGAAAAYLLTIVIQSVLYLGNTRLKGLSNASLSVLVCPACAILGGVIAVLTFHNCWVQLLVACILYQALLLLSRQLKFTDLRVVKRITGL